jgi:hypothetical protein
LRLPDPAAFWGPIHDVKIERAIVGEDRTGIVVLEDINNDPRLGLLLIGNKPQSRVPFSLGHVYLGVLGILTHPNPKSALIVGLGTGGTAYAAGANPSIERVRAVEILSGIYKALHSFVALGGKTALDRMFADPRFRFEEGDARHVLFTDAETYDIIEGDPIYPHASYSGLLYSVEYFRQLLARVNPGGIVVQWAPTRHIVNSFVTAFPYVIEFQNNLMLGSNRPIAFDAEAVANRLEEPAIRSYLEAAMSDIEGPRYKILPTSDIEGLRNAILATKVLKIWEPGDIRPKDFNTDLFPKDEFYLNAPAR